MNNINNNNNTTITTNQQTTIYLIAYILAWVFRRARVKDDDEKKDRVEKPVQVYPSDPGKPQFFTLKRTTVCIFVL